jgi:hypothetical protein
MKEERAFVARSHFRNYFVCTNFMRLGYFSFSFFVANTFQIEPFHNRLAIQAVVAFCFMPGACADIM